MNDSKDLRIKIGETFGPELIQNDAVDRKALGAFVFKNKVNLLENMFY
jgi:dephospho-CoA kinase